MSKQANDRLGDEGASDVPGRSAMRPAAAEDAPCETLPRRYYLSQYYVGFIGERGRNAATRRSR